MKAIKVILSRTASTAAYEGTGTLNASELRGDLAALPEVGKPLRVFLDNGRMVQTTAIERIVQAGSKMLVATRNSLYQLVFPEPLATS